MFSFEPDSTWKPLLDRPACNLQIFEKFREDAPKSGSQTFWSTWWAIDQRTVISDQLWFRQGLNYAKAVASMDEFYEFGSPPDHIQSNSPWLNCGVNRPAATSFSKKSLTSSRAACLHPYGASMRWKWCQLRLPPRVSGLKFNRKGSRLSSSNWSPLSEIQGSIISIFGDVSNWGALFSIIKVFIKPKKGTSFSDIKRNILIIMIMTLIPDYTFWIDPAGISITYIEASRLIVSWCYLCTCT